MKVKPSREVVIGLSVLLLLTVILVAVAVRRFTRPGPRPDNAIAQLEVPRGEPRSEPRGKEVEARRPTFADPAPAIEAPHEHNEPNPWVAHAAEKHAEKNAEKLAHAADADLKAIDAVPPSLAAQARHDDEQHQRAGREPAILAPEAADDRYAVPAASRADAARPVVIQVSGDSPTAPNVLPRNEGQRNEGLHNEAARDYSAAGRREIDAVENRRPAAAALPANEMPPATPNYPAANYSAPNYTQPNYAQPNDAQANYAAPNAARDPRYGYEPAAATQPVDSAASGYPGPGHARAEAPHREEFQRTVAENPLRSDGLYEVLPNDSYWTISQRVYGSGAYFRALAEANRGKAARPDRLPPGLLISTPPVAQLEKEYPDFCPRANRREALRNRSAATASLASYTGGRTYVVQEGDTLSSIARNELGKVSRWAEIVQLNRETLGKDYDYLTPGMKLALPPTESQSPDRTARRNDVAPPAARY